MKTLVFVIGLLLASLWSFVCWAWLAVFLVHCCCHWSSWVKPSFWFVLLWFGWFRLCVSSPLPVHTVSVPISIYLFEPNFEWWSFPPSPPYSMKCMLVHIDSVKSKTHLHTVYASTHLVLVYLRNLKCPSFVALVTEFLCSDFPNKNQIFVQSSPYLLQ